ncbi:thermonuclease family protein [Aspergillus undulatus]|uniref:thermonuclease family protein n=1 Tax=Aspergillus undulatus TaxID=1810928 RepID=UPI003CCD87CC
MRWPSWSPKPQSGDNHDNGEENNNNNNNNNSWLPFTTNINSAGSDKSTLDWAAFTEPQTLISTLILTTGILSVARFYRSYLRRFTDAPSIPTEHFRRRSVLGKVTSVGDGDNFRLYHTPGGRLAGWGWLPWKRVPKEKKDLRGNTIHIRLAGVDAPELAHFGRPEQPFARDAHDWLTSNLLNRRVRAYLHRPDQYQRAVATVYIRRALDFPIPFRRRDVSYEMLRKGLATVYEAKMGAEFGGAEMEASYRNAEWWAKLRGNGMWKGFRRNKEFESPREYKTRIGLEELGTGKEGNGNGVGKNGNGKNGHGKDAKK